MKCNCYNPIVQVSSVSIIVSILLLSMLFCERKNDHQSIAYVAAIHGLNMRKAPNTKSSIIILIPYGEKVSIIKTINREEIESGKKGAWTKVAWLKNTGWVFGAFLSDKIVNAEKKYTYTNCICDSFNKTI